MLTFFHIVGKFESKKSRSYDFIVNSGLQYKLAILKVCRRLIDTEKFPESKPGGGEVL